MSYTERDVFEKHQVLVPVLIIYYQKVKVGRSGPGSSPESSCPKKQGQQMWVLHLIHVYVKGHGKGQGYQQTNREVHSSKTVGHG